MWIAIEGGDGVGKTTAAKNICTILNNDAIVDADWIPACGGSTLGNEIREILKTDNLPAFTEECLFAAVLSLMLTHIDNNEAAGITTITDRSHVSSLVYSTIAKGNPKGWQYLYNEAVQHRVPDIIFHLFSNDLDEQIRRATKDKRQDSIDRYDNAGVEFYKKVNQGFCDILAERQYLPVTIPIQIDGKHPGDLATFMAELIKIRVNLLNNKVSSVRL